MKKSRRRPAQKPFRQPKAQGPVPADIIGPRSFKEAKDEVVVMQSLMQRRARILRERDEQVAQLEQQIEKLKERAKRDADRIVERVDGKAQRVYAYVETNRDTLAGEAKSLVFSLNNIGKWTSAAYVEIRDEKKLIEEIKRKGLTDELLVVTYVPDKTAIGKYLQTSALSNASRESRERFSFRFGGVEDRLEAVLSSTPRKWLIKKPDAKKKKP